MKFSAIVASAVLAVAVVDAVCLKDMCITAKDKCAKHKYDGAAHCQMRCGLNMTCRNGCVNNAADQIQKLCSPDECDAKFIQMWGEKSYEWCASTKFGNSATYSSRLLNTPCDLNIFHRSPLSSL